MTKTDEQINEELAKAMGWKPLTPVKSRWAGSPWRRWEDSNGKQVGSFDFCPATSYDSIHRHVVPVMKERKKMEAWAKDTCRRLDAPTLMDSFYSIDEEPEGTTYAGVAMAWNAPPRTLCEAAIAVMKGNGDD